MRLSELLSPIRQRSVIAVSMKPGAMAFTVMLRDPISSASDFVKPIIAAFELRSSSGPDCPRGHDRRDVDDPAPSRADHLLHHFLRDVKRGSRFVRSTARHADGFMRMKRSSSVTPALLTRMSMCWCARSAP